MLLITAYLAFRNPGTEDDLDGPLPADAPGSNDNGDPPHHAQGSGNDDWWTTYPAKHGSSGTEVEHPQWALDELPDRSIVLLVYSNCAGCLRQKDAIEKVLKDHKGDITYISISAYEDDRGAECDEVYGNGFIPLTIFITHIKTGNDINIAWHSQDGQTGEDWIRSYMEDAIYYHTQAG